MKIQEKSLNKKLLAAATSSSLTKEIKSLISQGANVNCTNQWGMTPLMLAAQYNTHVTVLKALISAGADINAVEPKYRSNALHLAANHSSNAKVIDVLIQHGADVNARNYLGETPLIMAVSSNPNTRVFTELLNNGADINICDWQDHSVMEYARKEKRAYVITVLKSLGL